MPAAFSISIQQPDFRHNVIAISHQPTTINQRPSANDHQP
jgi:hypothetical protein